MVLFAPDSVTSNDGIVASTHWAEMKEEWENVWLETRTETGLLDLTWEEVVKTLVATI